MAGAALQAAELPRLFTRAFRDCFVGLQIKAKSQVKILWSRFIRGRLIGSLCLFGKFQRRLRGLFWFGDRHGCGCRFRSLSWCRSYRYRRCFRSIGNDGGFGRSRDCRRWHGNRCFHRGWGDCFGRNMRCCRFGNSGNLLQAQEVHVQGVEVHESRAGSYDQDTQEHQFFAVHCISFPLQIAQFNQPADRTSSVRLTLSAISAHDKLHRHRWQ